MATSSTIIDLATFDFEKDASITEVSKKNADTPKPPDNIIAMVQEVFASQVKRTISFRGKPEVATAFHTAVRNAGPYTTPPTTVTANLDGVTVSFSAGERRGRKAGSGNGASSDTK